MNYNAEVEEAIKSYWKDRYDLTWEKNGAITKFTLTIYTSERKASGTFNLNIIDSIDHQVYFVLEKLYNNLVVEDNRKIEVEIQKLSSELKCLREEYSESINLYEIKKLENKLYWKERLYYELLNSGFLSFQKYLDNRRK